MCHTLNAQCNNWWENLHEHHHSIRLFSALFFDLCLFFDSCALAIRIVCICQSVVGSVCFLCFGCVCFRGGFYFRHHHDKNEKEHLILFGSDRRKTVVKYCIIAPLDTASIIITQRFYFISFYSFPFSAWCSQHPKRIHFHK